MIRGIRCEFPDRRKLDLPGVLAGVSCENEQIFMESCMLTHKNIRQEDQPRNVFLPYLREICGDAYVIFEMLLHIFPIGSCSTKIYDYEEFQNSSCICSILYYDCGYLEVYAKSRAWIARIEENLLAMDHERVEIITDENDTRTRFL